MSVVQWSLLEAALLDTIWPETKTATGVKVGQLSPMELGRFTSTAPPLQEIEIQLLQLLCRFVL